MTVLKKVDVYWNLHKNTYSIRYKGKVIGYSDNINLIKVSMIVNPGGYRRYTQTHTKNVHAFLRGYLCTENTFKDQSSTKIGYNPANCNQWLCKDTKKPIEWASGVQCKVTDGKPVVFAYGGLV